MVLPGRSSIDRSGPGDYSLPADSRACKSSLPPSCARLKTRVIMFPNLASMFLFIFCLFAGMLAAMEAGRRIGVRRRARDPEGAEIGLGTINGAVFGLMGLLIAFTFSGAASRFDKRRELVVQEANNIGTAYLRLDLLPASAQPALRERFRRYVDARIAAYRALPDAAAAA